MTINCEIQYLMIEIIKLNLVLSAMKTVFKNKILACTSHHKHAKFKAFCSLLPQQILILNFTNIWIAWTIFLDLKWLTLRKRHCGWLNKERQLQIAYILQRLYWKQTTEAHMALNSFLQECCLSIWSQINTVTICFYKQECDGKEKEVSYEHIVNKTRCIR